MLYNSYTNNPSGYLTMSTPEAAIDATDINIVLNWTGSALPTTGKRHVVDNLKAWHASNPLSSIHIMINTKEIRTEDKVKLASQMAELSGSPYYIQFIDTAKSFEENKMNSLFESRYREALAQYKNIGTLAHVFASDLARIAIMQRFKDKKVIYIDVDIKPQSLPELISTVPIGLNHWQEGDTKKLNNNIFYFDMGSAEAIHFLDQLSLSIIDKLQLVEDYIHAKITLDEHSSSEFDEVIDTYIPSGISLKKTTSVFDLERYGISHQNRTAMVLGLTGPGKWMETAKRITGGDVSKISLRAVSKTLGQLKEFLGVESTWTTQSEKKYDPNWELFHAIDTENFNDLKQLLRANQSLRVDVPFYSLCSCSNKEKISLQDLCTQKYQQTGETLWLAVVNELKPKASLQWSEEDMPDEVSSFIPGRSLKIYERIKVTDEDIFKDEIPEDVSTYCPQEKEKFHGRLIELIELHQQSECVGKQRYIVELLDTIELDTSTFDALCDALSFHIEVTADMLTIDEFKEHVTNVFCDKTLDKITAILNCDKHPELDISHFPRC